MVEEGEALARRDTLGRRVNRHSALGKTERLQDNPICGRGCLNGTYFSAAMLFSIAPVTLTRLPGTTTRAAISL
jgi:hypothetical protein